MDLYVDNGMFIYCFDCVSIVIHIVKFGNFFIFICASQYNMLKSSFCIGDSS